MLRWWKLALCLGLFGWGVAVPLAGIALPLSPAIPIDSNDGDPDLFDDYNLLAGTSFTSNADLAPFLVENDETFTGGEGSVAVLISTSASNRNTFGFYSDLGVGDDRTDLFNGMRGTRTLGPSFQATLFDPAGEVGFFLYTRGSNRDTWHSESDIDVPRAVFDHLVSFEFSDPLFVETSLGIVRIDDGRLLGWEDREDAATRDGDYDDIVILVGRMGTVTPEPVTGSLVGLGLVALGYVGRRRSV